MIMNKKHRYKNSLKFDFDSIVYYRLLNHFHVYTLTGRTVPKKELYRLFGLWFSLRKEETRLLLKQLTEEFQNIKLIPQGIKIKRS